MLLQKGMGEKQRWGYPVLGAVIGAFIIVGYIWSQFYPYLMEIYGISTVATLALGASALGLGNMIIAPPIAGIILDKWGPKVAFLCCAVYFIIGMALLKTMLNYSDWASAAKFWYIGSFFIGMALGTYAGTVPATCAKWFPDKFGAAVGIANIGPGVASVWLAPTVAKLIKSVGLGSTYITLGIMGTIIILVLGFLLWKAPEPGYQPAGWVPSVKSGGSESSFTLRDAIRIPEYWFLWACTFLVCLGGFLFAMNVATILLEGLSGIGGMAKSAVVSSIIPLFISITAIINAVARPVWGIVMDKIGNPWKTLAILYTGLAITFVIFLFLYTGPVTAVIGGCLVYLFFGGSSPVHMAAGPYIFGTEAAGKIMGSLLLATGIGWVIGSYLGAYLRDITGSYASPLIVAACLAVIGLILIVILSRRVAKKNMVKKDLGLPGQ